MKVKSAAPAADLTITVRILKYLLSLCAKELECGLLQDFSQSLQPG